MFYDCCLRVEKFAYLYRKLSIGHWGSKLLNNFQLYVYSLLMSFAVTAELLLIVCSGYPHI